MNAEAIKHLLKHQSEEATTKKQWRIYDLRKETSEKLIEFAQLFAAWIIFVFIGVLAGIVAIRWAFP